MTFGCERTTDGRYTFSGNLNRLCVCGHTLAFHGAGDPVCIFDTLPIDDQKGNAGANHPHCGCERFRPMRVR